MSEHSSNLALPYLQPAQAQKHVTVNEALVRLDAVCQAVVQSRSLAVQPDAPIDGARYLLPPGKTGPDWGTMADHAVAYYRDGYWEELPPRPGWTVLVLDEHAFVAFAGNGWTDPAAGRLSLSGGVLSGPLTTPSDGLLIGSGQFAAIGGKIAVGHTAPLSAFDLAGDLTLRGNLKGSSPAHAFTVGGDSDVTAGGYLQVFGSAHGLAGLMILGAGGAQRVILQADGVVRPASDNAYGLGSASFRWSDAYIANGVVTSSDARDKADVASCPLGLEFIMALQPRAYRRKVGRKSVRGDADGHPIETERPGVRLHTGLLAQDVKAALPHGFDWAGWVQTDPAAPESAQGLRYDQMIAPLIAAVQELAGRLAALERRSGR